MTEKRVIVLTGASSGLGAEVAAHFAAKGFAVVMNYIIEKEGRETYHRIAAEVGEERIMGYRADVADREEVRAMFDAVVERFGRVDILVNFAGINRDASFLEMTDEQWDSVISAHLRGHFVCSQEYVFHNPDREGLIINLGAACGQVGRTNGVNFCSAKGAIFALTKCMARELAPRIRVNCLVPGSIKTREVIDRYDLETDEGLAKELATLPMNRLGEFSDLIWMVECIIEAEFTTGANFYVNGGQLMI
jgi:NAD(P)-dependent dehydrogenase (short-subunit alcohol dehydrogenase family)